jgi:hypothetical protein
MKRKMVTYKYFKHNRHSHADKWEYQGKVKFPQGEDPPNGTWEIYEPVSKLPLKTKIWIILGSLWTILTAIKFIIDVIK